MHKLLFLIALLLTKLQIQSQINGTWRLEKIKLGKEHLVSTSANPMAFLSFTDSSVIIYESSILHNRKDSFFNFLYTSQLKLKRQNSRIQLLTDSGQFVFKGIYKLQNNQKSITLLDDDGRTIKLERIKALPKDGLKFKKSTVKMFTLLSPDTAGSALQEIYLARNASNRLVNLYKTAIIYVQSNSGQNYSVLGIVHHIDSLSNLLYIIPKNISEDRHKNTLFKKFVISKTSISPMIAVPVANIYRVAYYSNRATTLKTTGVVTCSLGGSLIQTAAIIFIAESICSSVPGSGAVVDPSDYMPILTAGLVTSAIGLALGIGVSNKYEITSNPYMPNSWQFVYRDYSPTNP